MAEEETAPEEGTEKKKKGLPSFVLPLVLALVGTGAGGFVGAKVVAPKLTAGFKDVISADVLAARGAKKGAHSAAGADEEAAAEGEGDAEAEGEAAKGGGEHGGEASAPPLYTISDLVLNPAGSGGTRFLMLSVAFDMKDSSAVATACAALLSDWFPKTTGTVIHVDGGFRAMGA